MPRAEVGSTKYVANKMKAKGLQRLRWYCQACQRQMRDENGFKCHVASESHVRQMMLIGEDPRRAINDYSNQFLRDFLQLLRTGHGEKKVNLNHFYQEYIANKEHVHMNATKWSSLTEFAKYLGREGICRVDTDEKNEDRFGASGLMISWIDNSPENLRRQEALKKKERQDRGDEEREQRLIQQQIKRARQEGRVSPDVVERHLEEDQEESSAVEGIRRNDNEKIVLNFGVKKSADNGKQPSPPLPDSDNPPSDEDLPKSENTVENNGSSLSTQENSGSAAEPGMSGQTSKPGFKMAPMASARPKNIFASASKKNALSSAMKTTVNAPARLMSEAERIMKEELERKRLREMNGSNGQIKRQRVS